MSGMYIHMYTFPVLISLIHQTWWGLTALEYHFESQCIPTPLGFHAHHLPKLLLKHSVAFTFVAQIGIVLFALSPNRRLRIFAGWTHIIHQTGIALTGNYNFFNLATMVLCCSCFDEDHFRFLINSKSSLRKRKPNQTESRIFRFGRIIFELGQLIGIFYFISKSVWVDSDNFEIYLLDTEEDQAKLRLLRDMLLKPVILAGIVAVCIGIVQDVWSSITTVVAAPLTLLIVTLSLVPFTDIDRSVSAQLPVQLRRLYQETGQFSLVHSYGLFRRMTGVGGRPEVVIELAGSDGVFHQVDFLYKPTNLKTPCPWVAPHQPRLDWQMWFAGKSTSRV